MRCSPRSVSYHRISCYGSQNDCTTSDRKSKTTWRDSTPVGRSAYQDGPSGFKMPIEERISPSTFQVEAAPSPRATESARESDPLLRGKLQQEREVPGTMESHSNEGVRDNKSEEQPGRLGQGPRPRRQHPGPQF